MRERSLKKFHNKIFSIKQSIPGNREDNWLNKGVGAVFTAPTAHAEVGTNMWKNPAPGGTRTHVLQIVWQMLYRFSHGGMWI